MKKANVFRMVIAAILCMCLFSAACAEAQVEITGGQVNLRSTPSLSGDELFVLFEGERVTYMNASRTDNRGVEWYLVDYYGYGQGWVSSRYARLVGNSWADSSEYIDSYGTVVATGGDSYIRSEPSLNGEKLAMLPEGASATYRGSSSTDDRGVRWDYVLYNGVYGWVSSRYTTLY